MKTNNIYDELMQLNQDNAGDRFRMGSMVMEQYDDKEMADTLRLLSGQMDFYDSEEGSPAVRKTCAELDALIAARQKRNANAYVKLLTDEMVFARSNGEVTEGSYSDVHSSFLKNGLFDPDIFGGSGEIPVFEKGFHTVDNSLFGTGMGHIVLSCHVVPESYYSMVGHLLDLSKKDVARVVSYAAYYITDPGHTNFQTGDVVSIKEYNDHESDRMLGVIGGDGIYELLKSLHYADKPERLAFQIVPVISPITRRMAYCTAAEKYYSSSINTAYEKVITKANRVKQIDAMQPPFVVLCNEHRILNEAVSELFDKLNEFEIKCLSRFKHVPSEYLVHNSCQVLFGSRKNILNFRQILPKKTGEIKSLGIYSETILLQAGDEVSEVPLEQVLDFNYDAMYDYEQAHIIEVPDGVDPDHLPEDLQKQADEAEDRMEYMKAVIDNIYKGAKYLREKFVVFYDTDLNMYTQVRSSDISK